MIPSRHLQEPDTLLRFIADDGMLAQVKFCIGWALGFGVGQNDDFNRRTQALLTDGGESSGLIS
jgi:hypothetical protein